MSRTPLRAAALTVAVLVLGACAPETSSVTDDGTPMPGQQIGGPAVDVDTPQLRAAKAEAGVADCVPGDAEPVEGGLPDVELACFGGGESVNLSSLPGPMVINLWASWCEPCRREMPVFEQFHATYGAQLPVLGINFNDSSADAAMELIAESGVSYPQLADTEPILTRYEDFTIAVRGLPVTLVVDADGEVVRAQAIAFDDVDELVAFVDEVVELTPEEQ